MMRIDLSWEDEESRKEETVPAAEETVAETAEAHAETMFIPGPDAGSAGNPEEIEEHIRQEIRADLDNPESVEMPSPEEMLVAEERDFLKFRRSAPGGEKVPLSDSEPDALRRIRAVPPSPEIKPSEPEPPKRRSGGISFLVAGLAAVVVIALGAILFLEFRGAVSQKLFGSRDETASILPRPSAPVEEPSPAPADSVIPAPAPSGPESTVVAASPAPEPTPSVPAPQPVAPAPPRPVIRARPVLPRDPVLAVLDRISKMTPARVWLTAETVEADGTYELAGMAFSHDALLAFVSAMEKSGTVTAKNIPPEAASPDAVYRFTTAGKFSGVDAPGVLSAVSPEQLSALANTLRALRKFSGMTIIREPRPETLYGDDELPYEVEGSYSGVAAFLGKLVSKGKYVIYRISIQPAVSGRPFNRVRVSFSIRTSS
ncbi:MAG: PilN domain-containing protein [Candidatus Latescibacterota bacterium]